MAISERPALPAGLPAWITVDAIEETIQAFLIDYSKELTVEDATEILLNLGSLFSVLRGGRRAKI